MRDCNDNDDDDDDLSHDTRWYQYITRQTNNKLKLSIRHSHLTEQINPKIHHSNFYKYLPNTIYQIRFNYNMHSTIAFSALALALSSNVFAAPLHQVRQNELTLADTVQLIAKTIGSNPNPDGLPDINNWHFEPVHSGAGTNLATLVDPSTASFNLSESGYFRNGTDAPHSDGGYMTAGFLTGTTPYSLVLDLVHEANSSNPGAQTGNVQFNAGVGTDGLDVPAGKLITSNYVTDSFWACPNVPIEGGVAIVVEVSNRYADPLEGCWSIELYAQCAGLISDSNRAAFPAFVQSSCYADATSAVVE